MIIDDAGAVHNLSEQLGYHLMPEETEEQIKLVLERTDHVAFVATADDKIIGWIHAFIALTIESKPFIEIGALVIDHNHRSKGVGKELVVKIKEWCFEKNIVSLRVRSNTKRKEAHAFYCKIGFKEIKEQKVFQLEV